MMRKRKMLGERWGEGEVRGRVVGKGGGGGHVIDNADETIEA